MARSSNPGWGSASCSWARHFTLTVPLSTQLYKWRGTGEFTSAMTAMTATPLQWLQWSCALCCALCCRNRDKLWLSGPLDLDTDFTFSQFSSVYHYYNMRLSLNRVTISIIESRLTLDRPWNQSVILANLSDIQANRGADFHCDKPE